MRTASSEKNNNNKIAFTLYYELSSHYLEGILSNMYSISHTIRLIDIEQTDGSISFPCTGLSEVGGSSCLLSKLGTDHGLHSAHAS